MNQALADACLRYLDGDLTEDERKAFDQLLVQSPEAADLLSQLALDEQSYRVMPAQSQEDLLAELVKLEAAAQPIPQELGGLDDADACGAQTGKPSGKPSGEQSPVTLAVLGDPGFWGHAARLALRTRPAKWAAAAVLLLTATLLFTFTVGNDAPQAPDHAGTPSEPSRIDPAQANSPVATLTATHNATWAPAPGTAPGPAASAARATARANPSHPPTPGTKLHPNQRLTLTTGFAEITTARGAIAIIQAPATIELTDHDNAIELHSGKLVGICETDSSKGFLVRTPHMDITDLGTRFGVDAHAQGVTATVFVGEIEITPDSGTPQRLTHSQTARLSIEQGRAALRIEATTAHGFTQYVPRPSVIRDASINDKRFNLEIAPQGVYEDALIYSDRDYQINGVDDQGLPQALLGGDLLRMPADARLGRTRDIGEVRVDVELSQPCDIYLIAAPDQGRIDWVQRDYDLTPMRVGLDQSGSFIRERAPVGLGTGPGESIDEIYHVWKRKQPAAGRVTFGPAHDLSMYSVVAIPTTKPTRRGPS